VLYFLFALGFKVADNFFAGTVFSIGLGGIYFIGAVVSAFAK
jgi:hypothetical protein